MRSHELFLLPVLLLTCVLSSKQCFGFDGDLDDEGEFIPTNEWQRVKDGQVIPPGLHIKMDLDKGGKWAKLNTGSDAGKGLPAITIKDDNPKKRKKSFMTEKEKSALKFWEENLKEYYPKDGKNTFSHEELKVALKNFKKEKRAVESGKELPKTRFRPIEKIKEDFDELNINVKTDYEVMTKLQTIYRDPTSTKENKINALKDMEFYVHQVDNAIDFVKLGGLADVILALNHTSSTIRREAARVIGSAVQSNPKAIEFGALNQLSRMLSDDNENYKVRKSSLFAISALIRQFPIAQTFFAKFGGFNTLMQLFRDQSTESVKLQIKAVRLMTDIMTERRQLTKLDNQYEEKLKQYNLLPMKSLIEDMHLCKELVNLLESERQHESLQAVLEALSEFKDICKSKITLKKTTNKLKKLEKKFTTLSNEENDDDINEYFTSLKNLASNLLQSFTLPKVEL